MLMPDVHAPNFVNRQESESLRGKGDKFNVVFGSGLEKCDGCYLHLDNNRSEIVRSGQTTAEFEKRQREHKNHPSFKMVLPNLDCFYSHFPIQQCLIQWVGNAVCGVTCNKWLGLAWHGIKASLS
jgi:hypothetical protein